MMDHKIKGKPEHTSLKKGDVIEVNSRGQVAVMRDGFPLEFACGQTYVQCLPLMAANPPGALNKHGYAYFLAQTFAAIAGLEKQVEENFTLTERGDHQFRII